MECYYSKQEQRYGRNKIKFGLLQIAIILSVLSQIDEIQRCLRPIMFLAWILFVIRSVIVVQRFNVSDYTILYAFCFLAYVVYCLLLTILGYDHLKSNYLRLMFLPFLMLIVSSLIKNGEYSIRDIAIPFVFSAVIFAIYVNIKYFSSYRDWLHTYEYTFVQKNSAAQIWAMAIFLCYFLLLKQICSKKKTLLYYCIIFYILFICFLSKCRTVLIGISVVIIFNFIVVAKHKMIILLGLGTAIFVAVRIPSVYTFLDKALGLSKLGQGVDAFSSGRISLYKKALEVFYESPLIGCGSYYVDCSYISILAESGIIGFLLIETVWFLQIARSARFALKNKNILGRFVVGSTVFYIIESIGEANPPFGPGVAAFMYWLMTEQIICKKFKDNIKYESNICFKLL